MTYPDLKIDPALLEDPVWSSLRRLLWYSFSQTNVEVLAHLAGTKHGGLTQSQVTVLRNMELEGVNLKSLAERIGVTKQAVTPMVRDLEALGYVRTVVDLKDRRSKIVLHTKRSLEFVELMIEADRKVEAELAKCLGKRRLSELKDALRCVISSGAGHQS